MDASLRNFGRKLGLLFLIAVALLAIQFLTHELLLLFAAIMLAILWRGTARWLHAKTRVPVGWALALTILVQFGVIAGLIALLAPNVAEQVSQLSDRLPQIVDEVKSAAQSSSVGQMLWKQLPDSSEWLGGDSQQITQRVFSFFTLTLGAVFDVVIIVVLATFLAIDPLLYVRGFLRLIPTEQRPRAAQVLITLNITLFRWFIGKILDMTSVGIMTAIGLWALGMPLVLTLSLIAFFFSFVPNLGPLLSAVPPVLLAFVQSPSMALYVALLYLGIQAFESYLITPNIQKHAIQMPPVLLLAVQVFFAKLLGALGLLLSTPILATVMILVKMLYVKGTLGDQHLDVAFEEEAARRSHALLPEEPSA
ncbi:Predicted PurR-regulated permease PerM [Catalinimonas alkaloidigena]|uniref:Predicted PurR-regulated permease PerM n=1 Tax=Catalinimonas alkaloidigena TaxID=1075417 RepID=A0A1G9UN78_9BACT|nr:AI-2E family transporter [Catalinimonas alkaloidigena]SDM61303.1 Predicted PurR-regulated permease PerM [Catalinimonas alkaloidigena]